MISIKNMKSDHLKSDNFMSSMSYRSSLARQKTWSSQINKGKKYNRFLCE